MCAMRIGQWLCIQYASPHGKGLGATGEGYGVCMDLQAPVIGTKLYVYMDNLYMLVGLLNDLRCNRKRLPAALFPKNVHLQRGEFKVAQKDDLACAVWMDTKPVLTLSNFHDPAEQGTVLQRREQFRTQLPVPKILQDYQQHMHGVDLMDQAVSYYAVNDRSKKWWLRVFLELRNYCVDP